MAQSLVSLSIMTRSEELRLAEVVDRLTEPPLVLSLALPLLQKGRVEACFPEWRRRFLGSAASVDELGEGLKYLQWLGAHELALELSLHAPLKGSEVQGVIRLDSLLALSRWDEARGLAQSLDSPVPRPSRDILALLIGFKTQAWDEVKARKGIYAVWQKARELGRTGAYVILGNLASEHGIHDLAADLFADALLHAPGNVMPVERFITSSRHAAWTTTRTLQTLEWKLAQDDSHWEVRKWMAYLHLLRGEEVERIASEAQAMLKELPSDAQLHLIAALASYRTGDGHSITHHLLPLPRRRWHAGEATVITALLRSAGHEAIAQKLATLTVQTHLWPEETQFLMRKSAWAANGK
jgi:hypothetical protein